MTPEEIANKYVHGDHDALTDSQEKKDMANDIMEYGKSEAMAFATFAVKYAEKSLYNKLSLNIMDDSNLWNLYLESKQK